MSQAVQAQALRMIAHFFKRHLPGLRVTHDAAFADVLAADLKLRLDQAEQLGLGLQKLHQVIEHLGDRDKGEIQGHQVDQLGDLFAAKVAQVAAIAYLDAGIVAQACVELTVADIDGVDPLCAALQQHVDKAAR